MPRQPALSDRYSYRVYPKATKAGKRRWVFYGYKRGADGKKRRVIQSTQPSPGKAEAMGRAWLRRAKRFGK